MVDTALVQERLSRLAGYIAFLDEKRALTLDQFVRNSTVEYAVERVLQLAIQVVIDVSTHVLATTTNVAPKDYADALFQLARIGVIPSEFADKIKGMPGFRNLLVHEYAKVDPEQVYRNMQLELDDFAQFARYVYEWLNREGLVN